MNQLLVAGDSANIYRPLARSGIGIPCEIHNNLAQRRISINGRIAAADDDVHNARNVPKGNVRLDRLAATIQAYSMSAPETGHHEEMKMPRP